MTLTRTQSPSTFPSTPPSSNHARTASTLSLGGVRRALISSRDRNLPCSSLLGSEISLRRRTSSSSSLSWRMEMDRFRTSVRDGVLWRVQPWGISGTDSKGLVRRAAKDEAARRSRSFMAGSSQFRRGELTCRRVKEVVARRLHPPMPWKARPMVNLEGVTGLWCFRLPRTLPKHQPP